jgi:hypothetical protein
VSEPGTERASEFAERRKPNGPKFVAARRKPSGLSASFRAKPGGLRRSATSVRHNSGAIGRKPPGEMRGELPINQPDGSRRSATFQQAASHTADSDYSASSAIRASS